MGYMISYPLSRFPRMDPGPWSRKLPAVDVPIGHILLILLSNSFHRMNQRITITRTKASKGNPLKQYNGTRTPSGGDANRRLVV